MPALPLVEASPAQAQAVDVAQIKQAMPAAGVEALEQDPDLRALANLLHAGDFNGFGFQPEPADFQDPELKDLIERCLVVGDSHSLPLTNLTPEMRWYYGRTSPKPPIQFKPTRRWRPQP